MEGGSSLTFLLNSFPSLPCFWETESVVETGGKVITDFSKVTLGFGLGASVGPEEGPDLLAGGDDDDGAEVTGNKPKRDGTRVAVRGGESSGDLILGSEFKT